VAETHADLLSAWFEQAGRAESPPDWWYENAWAEDIDWRAIEGAPDDVGVMHGRDAMRRYLGEWYEMFGGLTIVPEEFVDAGDGRVVVSLHVSGRAKGSGVPTEMRLGVVYTIREGEVVRGREYATREQALEAAGMAAD
jgi:ketosteroid isomerase-like protein